MPEYTYTLEEETIMIERGEYTIGEFIPDLKELPEEEEMEEIPPKFSSGTLKLIAIPLPPHFRDLFEEGDGLDKFQQTLKDYLDTAQALDSFLKQHPELEIKFDGLDFCIQLQLKLDKELELDESCLEELRSKLDPWLDLIMKAIDEASKR